MTVSRVGVLGRVLPLGGALLGVAGHDLQARCWSCTRLEFLISMVLPGPCARTASVGAGNPLTGDGDASVCKLPLHALKYLLAPFWWHFLFA